jgi:hypothetical protein
MEYPAKKPVATEVYAPSAVVKAGRWIDKSGDQITVAGTRAAAVALFDFSQADVDNRNGNPPSRLTAVNFGPVSVELGETVADKSFGTTDNVGRTVLADNDNDETLCYIHTGGNAGEFREAFVLGNYDTRNPAAALADLAGGATAADIVTAFNALLARLRLQKTLKAA